MLKINSFSYSYQFSTFLRIAALSYLSRALPYRRKFNRNDNENFTLGYSMLTLDCGMVKVCCGMVTIYCDMVTIFGKKKIEKL